MADDYVTPGPSRAEIDALPGPVVVDFGTNGCSHCRAARAPVAAAFAAHGAHGAHGAQDHVAHLRIEDGPGRRAGRSFGVKLWPTLVFLADGREVARVVRPADAATVEAALAALTAAWRSDRRSRLRPGDAA